MHSTTLAPRRERIFLIAWFDVIGFDFFLHAGLLARLYGQEHPFLLLPLEALRRIPLGYLAFGLQVAALIVLTIALQSLGLAATTRPG